MGYGLENVPKPQSLSDELELHHLREFVRTTSRTWTWRPHLKICMLHCSVSHLEMALVPLYQRNITAGLYGKLRWEMKMLYDGIAAFLLSLSS